MDFLGQSILIVRVGLFALGTLTIVLGGVILWKYKATFKEASALLAILVIVLSIPLGLSLVLKRTDNKPKAVIEIGIENFAFKKIDDNSLLIFFKTTQAAFAFIEFEDYQTNLTKPIISPKKDKSITHEFTIAIGDKGGKVSIYVNGKMIDQREIK